MPEGRAGQAVTWPVSSLPSHRQLRMCCPEGNAGDGGIKNMECFGYRKELRLSEYWILNIQGGYWIRVSLGIERKGLDYFADSTGNM